ncbi:MAG: hypothetical protein SGI83_06585 [Bacteroidota bacterium]|nr:hypothetical protein [Bacteroidota bacterium]
MGIFEFVKRFSTKEACEQYLRGKGRKKVSYPPVVTNHFITGFLLQSNGSALIVVKELI